MPPRRSSKQPSSSRPRPKRREPRFSSQKKNASRYRFHRDSSDLDAQPQRSSPSFFKKIFLGPFLLIHWMTRSWSFGFRFLSHSIFYSVFLGSLIVLFFAVYYVLRAQKFDLADVALMPERSIILDRNGVELGRLHGENRNVVPLAQISHHFRQALLAREDVRFYEHGAIDLYGIARAIVQNIKRKRFAQGASTLTMQLARNSFPLHEHQDRRAISQLDRKFLEIALAFRIERHYSKDAILEHYMNRIFWGHSIRGIEAAAQTYLETSAQKLTLSEAAMLAGIIRGPNAFSPFRHPKKSERERNTVLRSMVKYHFISENEAQEAMKEPLRIRPLSRRKTSQTYSMLSVEDKLNTLLETEVLARGGLTIRTTLDHQIQKIAEQALNRHLKKIEHSPHYKHRTRKEWSAQATAQAPDYLQGGLVLLENKSGAILAMVGGRNANESSFNRAYQAKRPVGSLFKPFVFLTAHDRYRSQRIHANAPIDPIVLPKTWVSDERMQAGEIAGAPLNWIPRNSDGKYYPLIHVQDALIQSRNTSSIRIGSIAGLENVIKTADLAGFDAHKIPHVPSCYLGTWNASPLQVASAYTVFPNLGTRAPHYLISEIKDRHGTILYQAPHFSASIATAGAVWATSHTLQQVVTRGTGSSLPRSYGFRYPSGGKTGTTNNYQDGWYVGYTSGLTCAVWVGLDRPKKVIEHGYGSSLALPIWAELMSSTAQEYPHFFKELTPPLSFIKCRLCQFSAQRATQSCEAQQCAYDAIIPKDLVPASDDYCTMHRSQKRNGMYEPPISPRRFSRPRAVPRQEPEQALPYEPSQPSRPPQKKRPTLEPPQALPLLP